MDLNEYVKFDDSCRQFEIVTGTQGKGAINLDGVR